MATKKQLRAEFLAKRAALTDAEYQSIDRALLEHFTALDFNGVKYLHTFLPLLKRREPDTTLLINGLKQAHPNIKIAYPQANLFTWNIDSFLEDEYLVLEESQWGIMEPIDGTWIDPRIIDMVIIPLLAFDKRGYRVGYGKGFYDRFLAECKPGTQFVGLSQFDAVSAIDDIDEFDIPLHKCITPNGIIEMR